MNNSAFFTLASLYRAHRTLFLVLLSVLLSLLTLHLVRDSYQPKPSITVSFHQKTSAPVHFALWYKTKESDEYTKEQLVVEKKAPREGVVSFELPITHLHQFRLAFLPVVDAELTLSKLKINDGEKDVPLSDLSAMIFFVSKDITVVKKGDTASWRCSRPVSKIRPKVPVNITAKTGIRWGVLAFVALSGFFGSYICLTLLVRELNNMRRAIHQTSEGIVMSRGLKQPSSALKPAVELICDYKETIYSLLLGMAFYLMTDDWFEKWKAYRLHFALSVLPFISHIVWVYANKRNEGASAPVILSLPSDKSLHKGWSVALIAAVVLLYAGIAFWNYCAWWMGDNWASHGYPWHWITRWYMKMNSRSGDIILRLTQQDYSRCIVWLTLPFFFILVAYSTIRLNGEKLPKASSYTGILLVCFVVSLCLLSVNTEYARDYIDFAPMTSYLWPTAATFLLLTHFHPHNGTCFVSHQNGISTRIKLALIFLLGIYCGWGNEVGCIMFTLFAVCWFSYQIWKKRAIALECWAATMGFIWGTCMIFLSPAHVGRQADSIANRLVNPQNMTSGELNAWLDNLTWDKINMLSYYGVIVLDGIPLMQHLKFLPFLAERFWNCCSTPSIALLILLAIALSRPGTKYRRRTILFVAIGGYSMAWLGACAYLAACIPGYPSFLPASYVIVLTCGWVFMQIPYKWIPQTVICAVILISACNIYGSAATIAYPYKALERKMWDEIQKQKNAGIKDIRLERRYRLNIRDGMGLLNGARFNDNPRKYPNRAAASYFKVRSIGYKDNTATQKPNDTPARK